MHTLIIDSIHKETPDAITIRFKIPENLQKEYTFIPGQYVFVQKEIDGQLYKRAYSISNSPFSNEISITVKGLTNGEFSKYITSQLKLGDSLEVSTPKGNFVLPIHSENEKNYMAFATGSGITPIYAMILAVLEGEPKSKFALFYGNKSSKDTIFKQKLDAFRILYPNRFFVEYLFSQEEEGHLIKGRISKELVTKTIQNKYKNTDWEQFYICGQEEMKIQVATALLENNISEDSLFFELYAKPKKSDEVQMTIILDGDEKIINVPKTKTILQAALDAGLDAPYSCEGGFCTACMAKILEGQAEMENDKTLDEDEIAEGKVLTCVAKATTDTLKVTFDI